VARIDVKEHQMMKGLTIVAEAAQGFEGDPTLARLLVRAAAAGGADVVKFQLVYADELATPDYDYFNLFHSLEMTDDAWKAVAEEASRLGLALAFDVFGTRSLELAIRLGAAAVKLHVSDFYNEPLFDAAVRTAPAVYFSVGGIREAEVRERLAGYDDALRAKLTMMVGFQAEPTQLSDNHIARLATWRARFPDVKLGFMDHADGDSDEASWLGVLAVAHGATVIEKHVTLDRGVQMEDYVSAATSSEFKQYAQRMRSAQAARGSAALDLTEAELAYRGRAVKVLIAAEDLGAGTALTSAHLRPLRGVMEAGKTPLRFYGEAVGRVLARPVARNKPIYQEDLA
jgi:N,N'-diacetyllegionaminate synthase